MTTSPMPDAFQGKHPRLLILDVDGVLTSNDVWIDGLGSEWKAFHVPDGTGIRLLQEVGVGLALISGRRSEVVHRRAEELGISHHLSGVHDKAQAVRELLAAQEVGSSDVVYVGDDLVDLPPMQIVGLPVAVANAHALVLEAACAVTRNAGGAGAVREVCEWILHARGEWGLALKRYLP